MAVSFVKQATGNSTSSSTSLTCTFGSATTAGNLLVLCMAGDKNTGNMTAAGWTAVPNVGNSPQTSVSLYQFWRVSTGETSFTITWSTSSTAGNTAWVGEYQDTAVAGSTWEVLGSALQTYSDTSATTKATGTTGTIANAGIGIACAAVDSSQSVTSVSAWGNSYSTRYSATGLAGRGAIFVAEKSEAGGGTTSSTFTYTGTADQVHAGIGVFRKVSSAVSADSDLAVTATCTAGAGVTRSGAADLAVTATPTADADVSATGTLTQFDAENGTHLADVTNTSLPGSSRTVGTGGYLRYDTAAAMHGTLGYAFSVPSALQCLIRASITSSKVQRFRGDFRLRAALTGTRPVMNWRNTVPGVAFRFVIDSVGRFVVHNASGVVVLTGPTLTVDTVYDVSFRVSVGTTTSNSTGTLKLYDSTGTQVGSTATVSNANFGTTALNAVDLGTNDTTTGAFAYDWDSLRFENDATSEFPPMAGGTEHTASADLAVTATLSADAAATRAGASALSVTASPTAAAERSVAASGSLPATATLDASAGRTTAASASLTVTASPSAAATVTTVAASSLAVTATSTAEASATRQAGADLATTATLTSAASRHANAVTTLQATVTLDSAASLTGQSQTDLPVTATLTATATVTRAGLNADADTVVTVGLTSSADKTSTAQAPLPVTATITAGAAVAAQVTASLTVTATPTAEATATGGATATLTVTVTTTAQADLASTATALLAATATLSAAASVVSAGELRDITLTASLGERRHHASLDGTRSTATIGDRRTTAGLGSRKATTTLDSRRFHAELPA